ITSTSQLLRRAPRSTLFPYTTLFRSQRDRAAERARRIFRDGQAGDDSRLLHVGDRHPPGAALQGQQVPARIRRLLGHHEKFFERSEEHTSELQSLAYLVCRLLLEKKK